MSGGLILYGEAPFQLIQHREPHASGLRKENVLARVKAILLKGLEAEPDPEG